MLDHPWSGVVPPIGCNRFSPCMAYSEQSWPPATVTVEQALAWHDFGNVFVSDVIVKSASLGPGEAPVLTNCGCDGSVHEGT